MNEAFHEIIDIVINALPAIALLTIIGVFVFGGGLSNLIDAMSSWALG